MCRPRSSARRFRASAGILCVMESGALCAWMNGCLILVLRGFLKPTTAADCYGRKLRRGARASALEGECTRELLLQSPFAATDNDVVRVLIA